MVRRRPGESDEEYRTRDAASRRERYARQKAAGLVPTDLLRVKRYQRAAGAKERVYQPGECIVDGCGDPPLALSKCQRHYRAQRRSEGVPWANEGNGAFKARARRHGVPYEPINRRVVFDRDGWICGICGGPVDEADASLDHIIPMSVGGGHLYANVQCSHLRCNVRKGARHGGEGVSRSRVAACGA